MTTTRTSSTLQSRVVTDLEGRRYTLTTLIGRGGQGVVFEVKEGRLAVKLLHSASEAERERLRRRLQAVKRLDLSGLPIASPIAVLRPPHAGYLMSLPDGMSSIRGIMSPPGDGHGVSTWYIATGGLRERLRRLGTIAEIFSRLHGRGLVYGDPSPENILFGSEDGHPCAFLIDADNLWTQSGRATVGVFTPGYGAPELIHGDTGPDTFTDTFALGVIAFEMLTLVHPFVGDLVHDGEPELEEGAFRGEMPWIEHSSDSTNRSSRGIDRSIVISPEVKKIFSRMFEDGLKQRLARPSLGEMTAAFFQAADVTVSCARCGASYYAPQRAECSWCGNPRPEVALALFNVWDPEMNSGSGGGFVTARSGPRRSVATIVLAPKEPIQILGRHVYSGITADQTDRQLVEATRTQTDCIRVRNLTGEPLLLVKHEGKDRTIDKLGMGAEKSLPISSRGSHWYLHFGPLDSLHRAVVFKPMS